MDETDENNDHPDAEILFPHQSNTMNKEKEDGYDFLPEATTLMKSKAARKNVTFDEALSYTEL